MSIFLLHKLSYDVNLLVLLKIRQVFILTIYWAQILVTQTLKKKNAVMTEKPQKAINKYNTKELLSKNYINSNCRSQNTISWLTT